MTELIVALDGDAAEMGGVFLRTYRELGQRWFKVGPQLLLQYSGRIFIENMIMEGDVNLFTDLKLYDTVDTVTATARYAWDFGARMLTVHATPRMLAAAMATKTDPRQKVIAVSPLTDDNNPWNSPIPYLHTISSADGIVCPSVGIATWLRAQQEGAGKTLVCPGIRPVGSAHNNHIAATTPAEARAAGTDFIVVGRPITRAADPVTAAQAILEELK